MSGTQVCEFELSPCANQFGEPVGMRVTFELVDGDLVINGTSTGTDEGKPYTGTLTLRPAGDAALTGGLEGGDECWVNGVWVSPCPPGNSEEDELIDA